MGLEQTFAWARTLSRAFTAELWLGYYLTPPVLNLRYRVSWPVRNVSCAGRVAQGQPTQNGFQPSVSRVGQLGWRSNPASFTHGLAPSRHLTFGSTAGRSVRTDAGFSGCRGSYLAHTRCTGHECTGVRATRAPADARRGWPAPGCWAGLTPSVVYVSIFWLPRAVSAWGPDLTCVTNLQSSSH